MNFPLGAAGKSATGGVRAVLSNLLVNMRMELNAGEGVGTSLSGDAFKTGRLLFSEEDLSALKQQAEEFPAKLLE